MAIIRLQNLFIIYYKKQTKRTIIS